MSPTVRLPRIRTAVTVPLWGLMGFSAGLLITISALNLLGFRSLVVMSGSMAPVLRTGDLVIDRQVTPLQVRTGDIVTFRDPNDATRLITHRVQSVHPVGDAVAFVTKGDANNSVQGWSIHSEGTMGRVVVRIPLAGYLIFWARSRFGVFAVLVIPTILMGASFLIRIWRPSRPEASPEPAA
jgi:signal peptidase I